MPEGTERILDVGCADGQVTLAISSEMECLTLGIDLDPMFIHRARTLHSDPLVGYEHTDLWHMKDSGAKFDAITFISCLHEFASYGGGNATIVRAMCDAYEALNPGGRIIIRDMMLSEDHWRFTPEKLNAMSWVVARNSGMDLARIKQFIERWGKPHSSTKVLNHLILKTQFEDIWGTEVQEDYFPMSPQDYHRILANILGMREVHSEAYLLDYIRDTHMVGKLGLMDEDAARLGSHGLLVYEKGV